VLPSCRRPSSKLSSRPSDRGPASRGRPSLPWCHVRIRRQYSPDDLSGLPANSALVLVACRREILTRMILEPVLHFLRDWTATFHTASGLSHRPGGGHEIELIVSETRPTGRPRGSRSPARSAGPSHIEVATITIQSSQRRAQENGYREIRRPRQLLHTGSRAASRIRPA
jgi:hypothetical protein